MGEIISLIVIFDHCYENFYQGKMKFSKIHREMSFQIIFFLDTMGYRNCILYEQYHYTYRCISIFLHFSLFPRNRRSQICNCKRELNMVKNLPILYTHSTHTHTSFSPSIAKVFHSPDAGEKLHVFAFEEACVVSTQCNRRSSTCCSF